MARVKIKDLPQDMRVSKKELRMIRGGVITSFQQQPILTDDYDGQYEAPYGTGGGVLIDTALAWKDLWWAYYGEDIPTP